MTFVVWEKKTRPTHITHNSSFMVIHLLKTNIKLAGWETDRLRTRPFSGVRVFIFYVTRLYIIFISCLCDLFMICLIMFISFLYNLCIVFISFLYHSLHHVYIICISLLLNLGLAQLMSPIRPFRRPQR